MNVDYIYDANTKALIDKFKGYLSDYENILMEKINGEANFSYMSDMDIQSSKRHAFLNDENRINLEAQLAKVYALAIPESIVFSETGRRQI